MDFTDTVYMFPSSIATLSPFDSFLVIVYSFCDVPIAIVTGFWKTDHFVTFEIINNSVYLGHSK